MTPDPRQRQALLVWLRSEADDACELDGADWRLRVACDMACLTVDVGLGPIAHNSSGHPSPAPNVDAVLADLQQVDPRVRPFRFPVEPDGWVETIAVPLDHPELLDRVAWWRRHPIDTTPPDAVDPRSV